MEGATLSEQIQKSNASNNSHITHKSNNERISEFISYFLILIFTYAALRVLADYKMFIKEIYGLTVMEVVKWGLAVICFAELVSVVLLIIPKFRLFGLIMALVVMFTLNIVSLIIIQRAPFIPTNLFGEIFHGVSYYGHLLINMIILFITLYGAINQLNVGK